MLLSVSVMKLFFHKSPPLSCSQIFFIPNMPVLFHTHPLCIGSCLCSNSLAGFFFFIFLYARANADFADFVTNSTLEWPEKTKV